MKRFDKLLRRGQRIRATPQRDRYHVEALERRALLDVLPPALVHPSGGSSFVELHGNAYFVGSGGGVHVTNGAAGGTFSLGVGSSGGLTLAGGAIYFTGYGSVWRSDGTPAGTVRLLPDPDETGDVGNAQGFTELNGDVYFYAEVPSRGSGLWKTDGTSAGTEFVVGVPSAEALTRAGGRIFFTANTSQHGRELWATDGTAAGTGMVKDIFPGIWSSFPSLSMRPIAALGEKLVFMAYDGLSPGWAAWVSDGTAAGTARLSAAYAYGEFTRVGSHVFFAGSDVAHRAQIWKTDGTPAGTVLVKRIPPDPPVYRPSEFTDVNGTLFFTAQDTTSSTNLWKSDGTEAGTVLIKGSATGTALNTIYNLTDVQGTLAFSAREPIGNSSVWGLWTSDGTTAGTRRIRHTFADGAPGWPGQVGALGSVALFTANNGVGGPELWAFQTSPNPPLPRAKARGPFDYAVDEGATLALHGYTTSQPFPDRPLTYAWDLDGDGTFGETGAAAPRGDERGTDVAFNAAGLDGPGTHTVHFRITDPTGYNSTDLANVMLKNVAPTLSATGAPAVLVEGNAYTLSLAASDPGPDTIAQWLIKWGDGTSTTISGSVKSLTHRYPTGYGTYGIEVLATDEDGTYGADRPAAYDATFGTGGIVVSNLAERDDTARNLVVQRDGKIVTVSSLQLSAQGSHTAILISRYTPDGSLDPTFGVSGRVQVNPLPNMYAGGVTVMPDGRIIASGSAWNGSILLSLLPDGSPDPAFGPGGYRTYEFGQHDTIAELAVTAGGRILGVGIGGGTGTGADRRTLLARFNPDGSLDPTFGSGGTVLVNDFFANDSGVQDMTLQPDGKILLVPYIYDALEEFRVMRFNPDGSPDTSFGGDGTATIDFSEHDDIATSLALAADGRIIVAGVAHRSAIRLAEWDTALARLNADGSIDDTFGTGGRWRSRPPGAGFVFPVARVLPDGRFLVAGSDRVGDTNRWYYNVSRFLADGAPDVGFGNAGTFVVDVQGNHNAAYLREVVLQRDGAALLYGGAGGLHDGAEALVRLVSPGLSARVTDAALPVVSIDAPATTLEGSTYTLGLSATDPDGDGIARWIVNWGDGAVQIVEGNPPSATHVYPDGPRAVTIRASALDGAGSMARATAAVSVANVAPTASFTAAPRAVRGARVPFTGSFTDLGADTHQVSWDFGDGTTPIGFHPSTDPSALTPRHAFSRPGTFTVTFRVRDDDGAVGTATRQITIVATEFTPDSAVPKPVGPTSGTRRGVEPLDLAGYAASDRGDLLIGELDVRVAQRLARELAELEVERFARDRSSVVDGVTGATPGAAHRR